MLTLTEAVWTVADFIFTYKSFGGCVIFVK
jgi:hypothetical protein